MPPRPGYGSPEGASDHFSLTLPRHETQALADRVWALRHQFTSYDAC
jgi:hypothetical protein